MKQKTALIMVDIQNDFCTGGQLAVPDGEKIVPIVNQLQPYFDEVIATKDWHPKDHISFADNHVGKTAGDIIDVQGVSQTLWPAHCIQNTKGAEFYPTLETHRIQKCFLKGIDKTIDSYSAFFDNAHLRSTGLSDYLREHHVTDVYLLGLATDYCVKFSCLDAVREGFKTYLIEDACRGVNLHPEDSAKALQEMKEKGVILIRSQNIMQGFQNAV